MFLTLLTACDHTVDRSEKHLRSIGYKVANCSDEDGGVAICSADGMQFRCAVASDNAGCHDGAVACERYLVQHPALEKP